MVTGFQRVPETRRPVKVNTLEGGTERDISHSFPGGKVELTGKNCTLLQCQTCQCSSGTPSDPWFSVDKEAKVQILVHLFSKCFSLENINTNEMYVNYF